MKQLLPTYEVSNAMNRDRRRFLRTLFASVAAGSLASGLPYSVAASTILRIVVFTQAGSVADFVARLVGKTLDETFDQKTIVETMTGAAGAIAADYVRRSRPDGRTLLLAHEGIMAIAPAIVPAMGPKLPYDPQSDFVPVALLVETDFLLVTNRSKGPHTFDEFVIEARKRPGQMNYASAGIGTPHHFGMELLKRQAEIDVVHVAYKTGPAAVADVAAGRVDVMLIGVAPALGHIKAGRLSVLGISGNQPSQLLPDVQLLSEKLPGFRLTTWLGLFAPAGTAQTTVEELERKIVDVMKSTGVAAALSSQGIIPAGASGNELRARLISDTEKFSRLARELKL